MIRLKKCSLIWLTLLLLLIATAVNAAEKNFVEIDIYSVNDFHGHLRAEAADPGIAVLSGVINELMKQNPVGSLLLGGGDMFSGTIDANEYQGLPVVTAMNKMGFSANTAGNHIFDYPLDVIKRQAAAANFPILGANIVEAAGDRVAEPFKPYIMLQRNGLTIGILGLTTVETKEKASQFNLQKVKILPPEQIAQVTPSAPIQEKGSTASVKAVSDRTVSGLQQPISNSEFIAEYGKPRNYGFNTAVGSSYSMGKNTIRACVHNDQTLMDGQTVKLRLLEPLQAGNVIVPKNSLVSGSAKVQGERLEILVSSLEYAGNIIPVELAVYDSDGQKGLSVPSSLEQEAAKEAMANIGAGLGTSISFAQSAGQQVAMDITRGLMQGGSQYLAKKFRTVKVHLKANYQVMLYAKQQ